MATFATDLNFNMVKFPIQLFEFEQLPDEEVTVAVSHFGVRNVDHVVVDVEVQLQMRSLFLYQWRPNMRLYLIKLWLTDRQHTD